MRKSGWLFWLRRVFAGLDFWSAPSLSKALLLGTFILVLIGGVARLVYVTGGIQFVYAHLMYLPILLAAFVFRIPGGVIAAVLGGLFLGPYMPINTQTGEMQDALNWLSRMGMFLLVGGLTGAMFSSLLNQLAVSRWLASHDNATRLPNRSEMLRRYERLLGNGEGPYGLLLVYLENLDQVIGAAGAQAGDGIIVQCYWRLRELLPSGTFLYQVSEQKLGALIPGGALSNSEALITRGREALLQSFVYREVPVHLATRLVLVGAEASGGGVEQMLQFGNMALGRALREGRYACAYQLGEEQGPRETLALLGAVPEAIKQAQFELHYQPKLSLNDNRVTGAEALLRWNRPGHGMVPPGAFIPQSELTELINPITHWVLDAAIEKLADWRARGLNLKLAINISTRNLQDESLIRRLESEIEHGRMNPDSLELEITESALMHDPELAIQLIDNIQHLGIGLSIDDFGTGHASLSYLHRLPVSKLKIDQSFVRNLTTSVKAQHLVSSIVNLARGLGMSTTAEGVEDRQTLDLLREIGCDSAQGYHICRPKPAAEFQQWLAEFQAGQLSPLGQQKVWRNS